MAGSPIFCLGTVAILFTVMRNSETSPRRLFDAIGRRDGGASLSFVMKMQIVAEVVPSKPSFRAITAGLGLPA